MNQLAILLLCMFHFADTGGDDRCLHKVTSEGKILLFRDENANETEKYQKCVNAVAPAGKVIVVSFGLHGEGYENRSYWDNACQNLDLDVTCHGLPILRYVYGLRGTKKPSSFHLGSNCKIFYNTQQCNVILWTSIIDNCWTLNDINPLYDGDAYLVIQSPNYLSADQPSSCTWTINKSTSDSKSCDNSFTLRFLSFNVSNSHLSAYVYGELVTRFTGFDLPEPFSFPDAGRLVYNSSGDNNDGGFLGVISTAGHCPNRYATGGAVKFFKEDRCKSNETWNPAFIPSKGKNVRLNFKSLKSDFCSPVIFTSGGVEVSRYPGVQEGDLYLGSGGEIAIGQQRSSICQCNDEGWTFPVSFASTDITAIFRSADLCNGTAKGTGVIRIKKLYGALCTWTIEAPAGKTLRLVVTDQYESTSQNSKGNTSVNYLQSLYFGSKERCLRTTDERMMMDIYNVYKPRREFFAGEKASIVVEDLVTFPTLDVRFDATEMVCSQNQEMRNCGVISAVKMTPESAGQCSWVLKKEGRLNLIILKFNILLTPTKGAFEVRIFRANKYFEFVSTFDTSSFDLEPWLILTSESLRVHAPTITLGGGAKLVFVQLAPPRADEYLGFNALFWTEDLETRTELHGAANVDIDHIRTYPEYRKRWNLHSTAGNVIQLKLGEIIYRYRLTIHVNTGAFSELIKSWNYEDIWQPGSPEPCIVGGSATVELYREPIMDAYWFFSVEKGPPSYAVRWSFTSIESCNITMSEAGVIETPGYPINYGNAVHCTWNLTSKKSDYIKLSFKDFDLESFCDIVEIYNSSELVARHSGSEIPPPLTLMNNSKIRFVSDKSVTSRGFKAMLTLAVQEVIQGSKPLAITRTVEETGRCPTKDNYQRQHDAKDGTAETYTFIGLATASMLMIMSALLVMAYRSIVQRLPSPVQASSTETASMSTYESRSVEGAAFGGDTTSVLLLHTDDTDIHSRVVRTFSNALQKYGGLLVFSSSVVPKSDMIFNMNWLRERLMNDSRIIIVWTEGARKIVSALNCGQIYRKYFDQFPGYFHIPETLRLLKHYPTLKEKACIVFYDDDVDANALALDTGQLLSFHILKDMSSLVSWLYGQRPSHGWSCEDEYKVSEELRKLTQYVADALAKRSLSPGMLNQAFGPAEEWDELRDSVLLPLSIFSGSQAYDRITECFTLNSFSNVSPGGDVQTSWWLPSERMSEEEMESAATTSRQRSEHVYARSVSQSFKLGRMRFDVTTDTSCALEQAMTAESDSLSFHHSDSEKENACNMSEN